MTKQVIDLGVTAKTRFETMLHLIIKLIQKGEMEEWKNYYYNQQDDSYRIPVGHVLAFYIQNHFRSNDKKPKDTITMLSDLYPQIFAGVRDMEHIMRFTIKSKTENLIENSLYCLDDVDKTRSNEKQEYSELVKQAALSLQIALKKDIVRPVIEKQDVSEYVKLVDGKIYISVNKVPRDLVKDLRVFIRKPRVCKRKRIPEETQCTYEKPSKSARLYVDEEQDVEQHMSISSDNETNQRQQLFEPFDYESNCNDDDIFINKINNIRLPLYVVTQVDSLSANVRKIMKRQVNNMSPKELYSAYEEDKQEGLVLFALYLEECL